MNKYNIHKKEIQNIISSFPMFFAFDNDQLKEWLKKLWAKSSDDIIWTWFGWYILKTDVEKYKQMLNDIDKKEKDFLLNDDDLFEALKYELWNHEFCITYNYNDALNSLWLDYKTLTDKQKEILKKAEKEYLKNCID